MEKRFDPRIVFHGVRPDWSCGGCEIVSCSGNTYEVGPAYVEQMVAGHTRQDKVKLSGKPDRFGAVFVVSGLVLAIDEIV